MITNIKAVPLKANASHEIPEIASHFTRVIVSNYLRDTVA